MSCRFCVTNLPEGRAVCHFHAKAIALRSSGRCIWCKKGRSETDFPSRPGSYCTACLTSRISQRGTQHRLSNALWRATA